MANPPEPVTPGAWQVFVAGTTFNSLIYFSGLRMEAWSARPCRISHRAPARKRVGHAGRDFGRLGVCDLIGRNKHPATGFVDSCHRPAGTRVPPRRSRLPAPGPFAYDLGWAGKSGATGTGWGHSAFGRRRHRHFLPRRQELPFWPLVVNTLRLAERALQRLGRHRLDARRYADGVLDEGRDLLGMLGQAAAVPVSRGVLPPAPSSRPCGPRASVR